MQNGYGTPLHKHLVRLCKEYQLEQLSPGNRLHEFVAPAIGLLKRRLKLEAILRNDRHCYVPSKGTVSLYKWISDVFIDLGTQAYFGHRLQEVEADLIRTFMRFEPLSWQAIYQYPSFLCQDMLVAKTKLQHAMAEFPRTPKLQRADTSWFIFKVEEQMIQRQIGLDGSAIFLFQLFWSINGNTRKAPFWILSYLLFGGEDLIDVIRSETASAIRKDSTVDVACLINEQHCPRLNSV
ncbi:hypothetical protein VTK56DRAFT_820 [Thermocarpiscus australiensis]